MRRLCRERQELKTRRLTHSPSGRRLSHGNGNRIPLSIDLEPRYFLNMAAMVPHRTRRLACIVQCRGVPVVSYDGPLIGTIGNEAELSADEGGLFVSSLPARRTFRPCRTVWIRPRATRAESSASPASRWTGVG